jgi:hypothetical protein
MQVYMVHQERSYGRVVLMWIFENWARSLPKSDQWAWIKWLKNYRNWGTHNINNEKSYLFGYNTVCFFESQPMFRRSIGPISWRSKNKPSFTTCFMLLVARVNIRLSWWRKYIPPKRRLTLNALQCLITHKINVLILKKVKKIFFFPPKFETIPLALKYEPVSWNGGTYTEGPRQSSSG